MCEQSLNDYITEQCALIDAALDRLLPAENESPETIHKAMRYSIFAGGKRMRPSFAWRRQRPAEDWQWTPWFPPAPWK